MKQRCSEYQKSSSRILSAAVASTALLFWALGESVAAAEYDPAVKEVVERADRAYQGGDCEKAISEYSELIVHDKADGALRNLAQFRVAYCQLNNGDSANAELGFNRVVGNDPANTEARARLAQSIFNQSRYRDAMAAARLVPAASPFKVEAMILSARSNIELGQHRTALLELEAIKPSADWKPVVDYWRAVAYYHGDEDVRAERLFVQARDTSPNTLWVRAEAQSWLESMKNESRRLHLQVVGGAFYDGNVEQSLTRTLSGAAGPSAMPGPGGNQVGAPISSSLSSAIQDRGLSVSVDADFTVYHSRKNHFSIGVESSGSFYQNQGSYNFQTLTGKVEGARQFSSSLSAGLSASYENTRYAYSYYQDYLILTPSLNWSIDSDLYLGLSAPLTTNMVTRPSFTYAPALSLRYDLGGSFILSGGASYTSANGQAAVYSSTTPPTVTSGTAFSRYTTIGGYLGLGTTLPLDIDASVQVSLYATSYAQESLTVPAGQPALQSRSDKLTTVQASLSRSIIPRLWSLSLSVSSASNASSGFPGVGSAGVIPDNNYSRIYGTLSTTLYY